ncbi:MAG: metal-dependent hydrolase [Oceanospirillaceae bacterium]|nr:metal-dependent hydrolase [Oceanospirillaceae bacterium]MBL34951.1 metal-dependent hydrolase [Oceanospirillaceae bacterium]MBS52409.1 metal-dependent hydrolase [Oceanospirillaceae bacterium]
MRRKNSSRTATKTYKTVPATTTSKAADRSGSSAPADRPAAVQFPAGNPPAGKSPVLKYLGSYSPQLQLQAKALLDQGKTEALLLKKYPLAHSLPSEKALYNYAQALKNEHMRSSSPISKVIYDDKIHIINNALGLHTYASRVQGNKLKSKNEIRISSLFRKVPEPLLKMILVHELAHLREKDHNKAFYKLCCYMEPDYHQLEFDLRLYLCHREQFGELW